MDLDDLRLFRAVVEEGGITRAAGKLLRAQSGVTTRRNQPEANLEVPLFVCKGKKLHRTLGDHAFDLATRSRLTNHRRACEGAKRQFSLSNTTISGRDHDDRDFSFCAMSNLWQTVPNGPPQFLRSKAYEDCNTGNRRNRWFSCRSPG